MPTLANLLSNATRERLLERLRELRALDREMRRDLLAQRQQLE